MIFQGTGSGRRYRKIAALLSLLLVVALTNGGCSLAIRLHDIESTDLTPVRVGATRAEVEEALGEPVESEAKGAQYVVTYEYDRGDRQDIGPLDVNEYVFNDGGPFWALMSEPVRLPGALGELRGRVYRQKARLPVTYGPDDTVIRLGPPEFWRPPKPPKKKEPCC